MGKNAIPEGLMTVGEVAKKMGVTVRTLQYYDREGLFSPSTTSEGGRRLYSDKDIVELHRVLSLKSLGFSIEEIKTKLNRLETPDEVAEALAEQAKSVKAQMDRLSESLREIELLRAEVLKMQKVDFKRYADIIVNLQLKNDAYFLIKYFDEKTVEKLRKRFDKKSALAMSEAVNRLWDRAAEFGLRGVSPRSDEAIAFAAEFWDTINEFTRGDMSMLSELMKFADILDKEDDCGRWKNAKAFVGDALGAYFEATGVNPLGGNIVE